MTLFSSLTNRIFFGSALLAVLAIGVAVYRINVAVTRQAEAELQRGLEEAATLLEEYRTTLFEHFSREARLVADLSMLKAAMTTKDPATVQPIADRYQRQMEPDLFVVTDQSGRVLAESGRLRVLQGSAAARAAIAEATRGRETLALWPHPGGVIQVTSVPSFFDQELVGTLSVGFSLDEEAAARFKALTNSEIAFAVGGQIEASTLPPRYNSELARIVGAKDQRTLVLGDDEFVALSRALPLSRDVASGGAPAGPVAQALILRSRTERLKILNPLHRELGVTAILAVLAATLLSYAIARTVTRPLGTITATMREMAATGDLTRKIALSPGSRWDDEDARLLATTFNTMTSSIDRFQRDAAQRERLSSLGRLSTVVAHEIRNPLMIIKAALRPLKREEIDPAAVRAAVADIDEEVVRLNRIVSEVLDFARPIKFTLAPVDLSALCADAAKAAGAAAGAPAIALDLEPGLGTIVTDAERLRLVLVNLLTNARHAVAARVDPPQGTGITLLLRRHPPARVVIEVRDRGAGIAQEDMARVFDPFFTTRRTGTGLGLAISRNIIEGLGGTITIASRIGHGTDVGIELPVAEGDPALHTG
jgi:signal transduction histidine kinase